MCQTLRYQYRVVDRKLTSGEIALASIGFAIASFFSSSILTPRALLAVAVLNVIGIWWGIKSLKDRKRNDILPATALCLNLIIGCIAGYAMIDRVRSHWHF